MKRFIVDKNGYFNSVDFKLKKYREKVGLTQRQLSKISGVSAAAISLIEKENRDPRLSTAMELCASIGVSIQEVCGLEPIFKSNIEYEAEIIRLKQRLNDINRLSNIKVKI